VRLINGIENIPSNLRNNYHFGKCHEENWGGIEQGNDNVHNSRVVNVLVQREIKKVDNV